MTAGSLPPRHTLPRDVIVPALPGLGLTWYDRGPEYWPRRLVLSLMWLVILAIIGAFDSGLFSAMRQSSRTGFDVFITIDALLSAGVVAWIAVRTVQRWNVAKPPTRPARPVFRFGPGLAGQLLSSLAQLGFLLLVFAGAVAFLICPGLFIAMFALSLLPETPTERQTRLWVAEQLNERGLAAQPDGSA
jgi:hypothetical protein